MKNLLLWLIVIIAFIGCSKKESSISIVKGGCNDPYALNYDPEAKENNGSCIYPFQGPWNGSFENGSGNGIENWYYSSSNNSNVIRSKGYLEKIKNYATEGKYCAALEIRTSHYDAMNLFQENVHFGNCKEVLLDYTKVASSSGLTFLELSFITDSSTVFIGHEDIDTTSKKDLRFLLPEMPKKPGIFMIAYKTDLVSYNGTLFIDNIRVIQ